MLSMRANIPAYRDGMQTYRDGMQNPCNMVSPSHATTAKYCAAAA
jgi:hypothetical protein